jgi:hypothetical protein
MGRTSLMMIIVFNMIFMLMGFRMSTATSAAYEKYCGYADIEQAGLTMESCANLAISNALLSVQNPSPVTLLSGQQIFGKVGTSFTAVQYPMFDAASVQIGESLRVIGSYPINIGGSVTVITCTTNVRVRGNAFAQFVFYSQHEQGIQWITGETCWGRLHTQDNLTINGNPDFKRRVTSKGNVILKNGSSDHPNFELGYGHADISIPTKLDDLTGYGSTAKGGAFYNGVDTYVQFLSTGQVVVRAATTSTAPQDAWAYTSTKTGYVSGSIPFYQVFNTVSDLTSSGVLLVQDAELHVKGVLNGQITLGCVDSKNGSGVNSNLSSVWIDSSVVYKDPPPSFQYPTNVSDDMLGIVSTNNITVSEYLNHDNSTTTSHGHTTQDGTPLGDVTIDASMFCQDAGAGFGSEDPGGRVSAILHVVGGVQQDTRQIVGQNGQGFRKDYDWDLNLQTRQPVGYPRTPFEVQNWVDNTTIPVGFWE